MAFHLRRLWAFPRAPSYLLIALSVLFLTYRFLFHGENQNMLSGSIPKSWLSQSCRTYAGEKQQRVIWEELKSLLQSHAPPIPEITLRESINSPNLSENVDDVPDVVIMADEEIRAMRHAHASFVEKIKGRHLQLNYRHGTKGIVTTSSRQHLGSVIISVNMLRRTNCTLPVEVIVSSNDDATSPLCTNMLSSLNAKCIAMEPSIGPEEDNPELIANRYLNKLFALLLSSFDDTLLLDSDNLPVMNPASYFDEEPYLTRGLVAWPDFWGSSVSKKHTQITSPTSHSLNATVESGQLLMSKSKHASTLLLAFYYNYHGPGYYYVLESQGAMGFGDKGKPYIYLKQLTYAERFNFSRNVPECRNRSQR